MLKTSDAANKRCPKQNAGQLPVYGSHPAFVVASICSGNGSCTSHFNLHVSP